MLSDELLRQFDATVRRWYPLAREAILFYETEEGLKATEAITEIRDALDHFYLATTIDNENVARDFLMVVDDHLRSAAVEPLERAVEQRLARVLTARARIVGPRRIFWRILMMKPPPLHVIDDATEEVKHHIRSGRMLKARVETAEEAIEQFKQGYKAVLRLERLFQQQSLDDRAFALALQIISGILFLLIGLALGWAVNQ